MRRSTCRLFACCVLLGAVWLAERLPASAQEPTGSREARLVAMERLAYMVGAWEGEGWIERQGTRSVFRGGERVQSKLGAAVLLVEGLFNARLPGAEADVPVHTTLGVIWYDPEAREYRFTTWVAGGGKAERALELLDDGWRWYLETDGGGRIRYTMTLTPAGEWFEVGEFSADGQRWAQFFEMTLRRE
ncbi:MAG: hypothetical protein ACRELV_03915 [Longimicrobiales bacterium]